MRTSFYRCRSLFSATMKAHKVATQSVCFSTKNTNEYCMTDIDEHMDHVADAVSMAESSIINDLKRNGFAIFDGLLGAKTCEMYRSEAESLYQNGSMEISRSTKWDTDTQSIVTYDKHNVYSMQLMGGQSYETAPRLHEYVVAMIRAIEPAISEAFPEAHLSSAVASNKLAVCLGDGSSYDKHFDSSGSGDLRKLTVLYYMNNEWQAAHGGQFRIYHSSLLGTASNTIEGADNKESAGASSAVQTNKLEPGYTDVEPRGDRLLMFWSDRTEHSVQPSFTPRGSADYRYALTVWIATSDASTIHM